MKTILRTFLSSLFALWAVTQLISGFKIIGDWQTYLLAAAMLSFIFIFVRPILKLLFLPINFLSLGLLSWLINVVVLYLLTMLVPQIKISPWQFIGITYQGLVIPAYDFNQIGTFILVSFALSFIVNFFTWLYH